MAKVQNENKRRDKDRIVLRRGESQRANGSYMYRWVDEDGNIYPVDALENITFDGQDTKWVCGEDGFYYYTEILPIDETTGYLFETMKFVDKEEENQMLEDGYHLEMDILADGIQTEGYEDADKDGDIDYLDAWSTVKNK